MRILFSQDEINSISLRHTKRPDFSEFYVKAREKVWQTQLSESGRNNRHLWNGEIYTIENIIQFDESQLLLEMSTCEFKDVLFRFEWGVAAIYKKFGAHHIPKYVTVDCIPVTNDGKFVFGVRNDQSHIKSNTLGLIGGTLNKDEMSISSFEDIITFMGGEIREETLLEFNDRDIKLFSLNFFRGKYEFLFTFQTTAHSTEVTNLNQPNEFIELVAMDLNEAMSVRRNGLDAFRYAQNYLSQLNQFMKG